MYVKENNILSTFLHNFTKSLFLYDLTIFIAILLDHRSVEIIFHVILLRDIQGEQNQILLFYLPITFLLLQIDHYLF